MASWGRLVIGLSALTLRGFVLSPQPLTGSSAITSRRPTTPAALFRVSSCTLLFAGPNSPYTTQPATETKASQSAGAQD